MMPVERSVQSNLGRKKDTVLVRTDVEVTHEQVSCGLDIVMSCMLTRDARIPDEAPKTLMPCRRLTSRTAHRMGRGRLCKIL